MGFVPTDVGEYVCTLNALGHNTFTSAQSTNPATGYTIDRFAFNAGRGASCQISVLWNGTTTGVKTINVNAYLQHSDTSTAWTNYSSTVQATDATGVYTVVTTAASTQRGIYRRNINLIGAKRYVRVRANGWVNMDNSTIMTLRGVLTFGGFDAYPVST